MDLWEFSENALNLVIKEETRINYLRVVYGLSDVHDVDNVLDRKNDNG